MESREAAGSLLNPLVGDPFLGLTDPPLAGWLAQQPTPNTPTRPTPRPDTRADELPPVVQQAGAARRSDLGLPGGRELARPDAPAGVVTFASWPDRLTPTAAPTPELPPIAPTPLAPPPGGGDLVGLPGAAPFGLFNGMGFGGGDGGDATLTEELPVVSVSAYDPYATELAVQPGPTSGVFEFTRTGDTTNALTVKYRVDGTATPDVDYTGLGTLTLEEIDGQFVKTGTVTIPANKEFATRKVDALDDTLVEGDEAIDITVLSVAASYTAAADRKTDTVTVLDNDRPTTGAVWVGRVDATSQENYANPSSPNTGLIEVTRSALDGPLTVNYTLGGDAVQGTDYKLMVETKYAPVVLTGPINFAAGQDTVTIKVVPLTDGVDGNVIESVQFALASGTGYELGNPFEAAVAVYDIRPPAGSPPPWDDYTIPVPSQVFVTTGSVPDGKGGTLVGDSAANEVTADPGSFLVTHTYRAYDPGAPLPDPARPEWTISGSAVEGVDYKLTAARVVANRQDGWAWDPWVPDRKIYDVSCVDRVTITPINDGEQSGNEYVDLVVPIGGELLGGLNDIDNKVTISAPNLPKVWVEAPDWVSAEQDVSTGSFRVVRNETNLGNPLTVSYALAGSAGLGSDYTATGKNGSVSGSGTMTFPAGVRDLEIKVTPADDATEEDLEEVSLTLSSAAEYVLSAAPTATVVVLDNDGAKGKLEVGDKNGKWWKSGWVAVNNDNDNYNFLAASPEGAATSLDHFFDKDETGTVAGENDLIPIRITMQNAVGKSVHIQFTSPRIKVWTAPERTQRVLSVETQYQIDAANWEKTLYVEGLSLSEAINEVQLSLVLTGPGQPAKVLDQVKLTTFDIVGVMNVPGYSKEIYRATAPAGATPKFVSVVGGTKTPDSALNFARGNRGPTTTLTTILWGEGAMVATYRVAPTAAAINFAAVRDVNVVKIDTSPDATDRITLNDKLHQLTGANRNWIESLNGDTPAMMALMTVASIHGPIVNGQMRGVRFVELGYIQQIRHTHFYADYDGFDPKKRLSLKIPSQYLLDANADYPEFHPWYRNSETGEGPIPGTVEYYAPRYDPAAALKADFSIDDSPTNVITDPDRWTWWIMANGQKDQVDRTKVVRDFKLYFAVASLEPATAPKRYFTQRASVVWQLDSSGTVDATGTWAKTGNGVTTPNSIFSPVTDGSVVEVTEGPVANEYLGEINEFTAYFLVSNQPN